MHFSPVKASLFLCILLAFATTLYARNFADSKLSVSGVGVLEYGSIPKSSDVSNDHRYSGTPLFWILGLMNVHADINENWTADVETGAMLYFPARSRLSDAYQVNRMSLVVLSKAVTSYSIGTFDNPFFAIDIGYFPVRTNPYVKNLGEYLLRGPVYPGYLFGGFEKVNDIKIAGVRTHARIDSLKLDLYAISETELKPFYDISLAAMSSYNMGGFAEVGAGVNYYHILPIEEELTKYPGRVLQSSGDDPSNDENVHLIFEPRYDNSGDTLRDSEGDALYDTTYLDHQGIKISGRLMFDPKKFMPETRFFKKEDLRIYSEAAILGVHGQKHYYDDISERIPVMVGFNMPSHPLISYGSLTLFNILDLISEQNDDMNIFGEKINPPSSVSAAILWPVTGITTFLVNKFFGIDMGLDVMAYEIEYYKSPYRGDYKYLNERMSAAPRPTSEYTVYSPEAGESISTFSPHRDDIKWSVYARKVIKNHFVVSGQIANDHFRTSGSGYFPTYDEANSAPVDWNWKLRLMVLL